MGNRIRAVDTNLWVVERPFALLGAVEIGTRMTLVRLRDGDLFLHSPIALDDELRAEVERLGTVRHLVAPNRMHHLFLGNWMEAFPGAKCHGAPGLAGKRPDLRFDSTLGEGGVTPWAEEIDSELVAGLPLLEEVAFLHRASRSLLLCDLAFHIGAEASWGTRTLFRLLGGYGRLGPTVVEKLLVRDRRAARRSLDRILGWDFDRVIVSHGTLQESGGKPALQAAYAWLK